MERWKGYTECHRQGGVLSTHFHPYSPCFPSNSSSGARASLRRRRLFLGRLWLLRLLPVSAAAAPLKAVAIDVRCHSCTAPDVDAPATGGLLVPRTNTLLPPRFFAPTNQFAGRWHGNACGGLPPRRALLRSLSHSFAASQSNAPAITGGEIEMPRRWRRRREARAVKQAVASKRTETERQDPLALSDGWRSGPGVHSTLPTCHCDPAQTPPGCRRPGCSSLGTAQ